MSEVSSISSTSEQAFMTLNQTDSSSNLDLNKQLEDGLENSISEDKKHSEELHQANEVTTLFMERNTR
jgi:hypothetical protein